MSHFTSSMFVIFPPFTNDEIIFGKNSDRPADEAQEIVYFPQMCYGDIDKLKCTGVEMTQEKKTRSIIISKPSNVWGAESGANSSGVVIGVAIRKDSSNENIDGKITSLDLVRLGLERCDTAESSLNLITELLEKFEKCDYKSDGISIFLIVDKKEAWILETYNNVWAAEKLSGGIKYVTDSFSITTKIDKMSKNLKSYAIDNKLWDEQEEFDFKKIFGAYHKVRLCDDIKKLTGDKESDFNICSAFELLRKEQICLSQLNDKGLIAATSQVSCLTEKHHCVHWFTGTPDPNKSVFKPFVFTDNSKISNHTTVNTNSEDGLTNLVRLHGKTTKNDLSVVELLKKMEQQAVNEMNQILQDGASVPGELDELMKDCVETEVRFYK